MVDWALVNGGSCEDGSAYSPRPEDQTLAPPESARNTDLIIEDCFALKCDKCGLKMRVRNGTYGPFWVCPNSTPMDSHPTFSARKKKTMIYSVDYPEEKEHDT